MDNGELKKGYKRTEIGVIPEDWEVILLCNVVDFLDGSRKPIKSSQREKMRGIYPYYGASGIIDYVNGYLFDEDLILLGEDGENILSRNMRLAFKISGKVWVNNHAHVLRPRFGYDINFLTEYLESIDYSTYNSGTAQPKLNKKTCEKIPVAKPSFKEQHAIATALSDVDALIAALDKLIVKKCAIKTAVMQQLLTGKKRLPGFSGPWKVINMDKHSVLKARIGWQGLKTDEYLENGEYFLVTGTDFLNGRINWGNCFCVDQWRYAQDKNIQLKNDDVLITKDGTIGKIGYVDYLPGPATLNSGVFVIRPIGEAYYPLFLYYVLSSEVFDEFLRKLQAGSTISHLYQKDFVNFEFVAPDIKEQKAIAETLSDMDTEITALESRLNKTQAIKQGMMQELLTGRTRLI